MLVLAWTLATAFGVLVFAGGLIPVRRRKNGDRTRWARPLAFAHAAAVPVSTPAPSVGRAPDDGTVVAARPAPVVRPDATRDGGSLTSGSRGREPLRFHAPARPGVERRTIAYHLVRMADQPDDTTSSEICRLDRGDEVEVIGEHEGFLRVRTPTGLEGWVQRMVLIG